jgi:hypothetical protein
MFAGSSDLAAVEMKTVTDSAMSTARTKDRVRRNPSDRVVCSCIDPNVIRPDLICSSHNGAFSLLVF